MHEQVYNLPNIELADRKARRHKSVRWGILKHDKRREKENLKLAETLRDLTYKTSNYSTFKIYEPKERLIFRLPYYPDRITHHAIMNIMEPIWVNIFIKHTYSCIKDRGIHDVAKDLKYVLQKYPEETKYCLKLDVRKFYPSIDHDILYEILQKKIKDKKLLTLLKEVNISKFYGKYVHIVEVINYNKYFRVHCVYNNKSYYFESKNKQLFYSIHRYSLPVNFKITPYVRPKKNRNKPATRTD